MKALPHLTLETPSSFLWEACFRRPFVAKGQDHLVFQSVFQSAPQPVFNRHFDASVLRYFSLSALQYIKTQNITPPHYRHAVPLYTSHGAVLPLCMSVLSVRLIGLMHTTGEIDGLIGLTGLIGGDT